MSVLHAARGWDRWLQGESRDRLEREALPAFLRRQRWFAGKARELESVRLVDATRPGDLPGAAMLAFVEVRYGDGGSDTYLMPLAVADGPEADRWAREAPGSVVGRIDGPEGGTLVYDALADPLVGAAFLEAIERGRTIATRDGSVVAAPTAAYASVRGRDGAALAVVPKTVEQSNSVVLYGDRLILKVIRRLEPGLNPEFEIGRFLSEKIRFDHIPPVAGGLDYRRPGAEPTSLAILQALIPNEGTGWDHALRELRGYYARVGGRPFSDDLAALAGRPDLEAAGVETPPAPWAAVGSYLDAAAMLGRRTAELHLALASEPDDPAFAPEPLTAADLSALAAGTREQVEASLAALRDRLDQLPESARPAASRVLEGTRALLASLDELPTLPMDATRIRVHGDYHLGQVLRTGDDFVILDFEGEPAKPLARRREKVSPIKDLVGMLRSFDYASYAALFAATEGRPDDFERLAPWAELWRTWTSASFLRQYFATADGAAFLPADPAHLAALLRAYTLDKALYELLYELNNRPTWVRIPLQGVLALVEPGPGGEPSRPTPGRPQAPSPWLTDFDLHLMHEGTHHRSYEKLGAHVTIHEGAAGTLFAVWAPNAREVSVLGEFNGWDPRATPMARRGESGIWARFVPGIGPGASYMYSIVGHDGGDRVLKADPYGFAADVRPGTASKVWDISGYEWGDAEWLATRRGVNSLGAPIAIYEVHLGSWMRVPEESDRWLTYRELGPKLADYASEMGYTHVELLPVAEHPFDGSWGYQSTGYFAPTSRFGTPDDFMAFVDTLHRRGLGVILDWVPAHFPRDEHGLGLFDGTHLYEHADPRRGLHQDWDTFIFNYGRPQVANFLTSNALFWLDKYHVDGLRVDAVASMLYLDYSREDGEWVPNEYGGRENLEAIAFLRRFNERVHAEFPGVLTIAEDSTAWPMVTRPTDVGGLGFDLKWDLGWMHDMLAYMAIDPIHRKENHGKLTFRGLYAFTENFILPLSHDEVVYGKGSLLAKMPGDTWQKFANLRLLLGTMYAQPGKKLLFMGDEFGQWREWNHDTSLDWHLLSEPMHRGLRRWVRDLNTLYRGEPALHELDCHPDGFAWVDCNDAEQSVLSLLRKGRSTGDVVLVVCNFTPVPRHNYRVGVPRGGHWAEILNGDATLYGGSGQGNIGGVATTPVYWHGQPQSLNITLPPLAVVAFRSPK
jgi:1,4-alpha-glucan branching enzyme